MSKIPFRSCVGCRRSGQKDEFIRIVKSTEGTVFLDSTGKAPGRGAYLCRSSDCLKKARKGSRLSRALRTTVPADISSELDAVIIGENLS